jgi:outer membrane protein assembly factor BamB
MHLPSGLWLMIALFAATGAASDPGTAAGAEPPAWSQWRGPSRDAFVSAPAWPGTLAGEALKPLWRVELGPSYSGPVASAGVVFTTATDEQKWEVVRAFEGPTGKKLWEARWESALQVPFFAASHGSWMRATPALSDDRLYVAGMRDVLVCLDARTGQEFWKLDFPAKLKSPLPAFGFASSPLVFGEHVYVQAGAALTKLNKLTGEVVWQSLRDDGGMYGSAFSSPYLTKLCGIEQLVVQTRTHLAGVAPDDGRELWSQEIPAFRGMNILTPTVLDDTIFTSSYGGKSLLLRVEKTDAGFAVREAWNHRSQGYMSTPVIIDGHAYLHLRNQRFTCLDLKTGEERWTTKPYGQYWSMAAQGPRILALDERGDLLLIDADPREFKLIDSRHVSDSPTWGHLAVCGDILYVRELNALAAYRWKG